MLYQLNDVYDEFQAYYIKITQDEQKLEKVHIQFKYDNQLIQ